MVNRIADALISHGAVEYGHFVLASGADRLVLPGYQSLQ